MWKIHRNKIVMYVLNDVQFVTTITNKIKTLVFTVAIIAREKTKKLHNSYKILYDSK